MGEPCDSVLLHRSLLRAASAGGTDPSHLAQQAGLPPGVLVNDKAMIPSRLYLRLWELTERALDDPYAPLAIAGRHHAGELGLYDYLFTSAATLRDGMAVASDFLHLVTTNGELEVRAGADRCGTYTFRTAGSGGRGEQLFLQYCAALLCVRARAATAAPVVPVRVCISAPAPRSARRFIDTFGTRDLHFGAAATSVTFGPGELSTPMTGADSVLAGILRAHAPVFTPQPAVSFLDAFNRALAETIRHGAPSLREVANRLSISSRTLQRRLGEHGTCWRAELDSRRRSIASHSNSTKMASLTRELGYADARSLRRALRRWNYATE